MAMPSRTRLQTLAICGLLLTVGSAFGQAQVGTAFTYQGVLDDAGMPANGTYDFEFRLMSHPTIGNVPIASVVVEDVEVVDGLFTATVNFGSGQFNQFQRWLEIGVRIFDRDPWTTLTPRRGMTAAPYALALRLPYAASANLGSDPALKITNLGSGGVADFRGFIINDAPTLFAQSTSSENTAHAAHFEKTGSNNASAVFGEASNGGEAGNFAYSDNNDNGNAIVASCAAPGGFLLSGVASGGADGIISTIANGNGDALLAIQSGFGGNFGTGQAARFAILPTGNSSHAVEIDNNGTGRGLYIHNDNSSSNSPALYCTTAGNGLALHADGPMRCDILQIAGGSDLSEGFDVNGTVEPGMVVVIDPENPGKLLPANSAYDKKVAGVVSGANGIKTGMVMGQEGSIASGEHPIALTGRVYVYADADNGPIEPGDLLTTSNIPGHAMKVTNHNRAHGATLGKAMSRLDTGRGLVLVLVNLH